MTQDSFPEEVIEKLKWYVYRLIDPRNGETFYVGKGQGNRVFDHARGDIGGDEDSRDPKKQIISDIRETGLDVAHIIHRHGMCQKNAYEVEAALIDAYPGLSNKVIGHRSREHGSRHAVEIIAKYKAEEFKATENFILFSIGKVHRTSEPFNVVQGFWKLKKEKASKYKLVLAQVEGLVKGAYRPEEWLEATKENFPDNPRMTESIPGRYGFKGKEAEPEIRQQYVGKRVPKKYLGSSNPIRYCDI